MLAWMLLIVSGLAPWDESRADLIELNHVHDEQAVCTFSQVIVWKDGRVAWWCHARNAGHVRKVGPQYRMDVIVGGRWYRVTAPTFRETYTQYDPEVIDRDFLPKELRVGL